MNKQFSFLILIVGCCVLTACGGAPSVLRVQVYPENHEISYIRAYETSKPHVKRDMLPERRGMYSARFSEDTEVTVVVSDGKKEIKKTIAIPEESEQYMEFNAGILAPSVDFIRMKANRELEFKPINKSKQKKAIYVSYIDYIGQNLLLKQNLEKHLEALGYEIIQVPNETTELIATVNLVDFSSSKESQDFNDFVVNQYKFKINIEQRLTGKTIVEEKHAYNTTELDDITYQEKSYPLDDTHKQQQEEVSKDSILLEAAEAPTSPGLLVMLGVVADEEGGGKEEKKEEKKEEGAPADPAAAAGAAAGSGEKKEEGGEKKEGGGGKEVPSPSSMVGNNAFLNTRGAIANSLFNYHLYQEEVIVEASIRLTNLTPQDERAIAHIINLLSFRLANLFNL